VDTLADAIASCATTAGSVSGDGSICDQFFAASKPGATLAQRVGNTLQAMITVAQSETGTVDDAALYRLAMSSDSFQPVLAEQPVNWTLPVSFSSVPPGTILDGQAVSVDSAGNIWIGSGDNGATEFVGASSSVSDAKTLIPLAAAVEESQQ
jgi:hypothetical protein